MALSEQKQLQVADASNRIQNQMNSADQMVQELRTLAGTATPVQDQFNVGAYVSAQDSTAHKLNQGFQAIEREAMEHREEVWDRDRTTKEQLSDAGLAVQSGIVGIAQMGQGALTRLAASDAQGMHGGAVTALSEENLSTEEKAERKAHRFLEQYEKSKELDKVQKHLKAEKSEPMQLRGDIVDEEIKIKKAERAEKNQAKKDAGKWTAVDTAKEVGAEFADALESTIERPSLIVDMALENLPDLLIGGIAGKALSGAAKTAETAAKIAAATGVATSAIQEGLDNANSVMLEVMDMDHATLLKNSPSYKDMIDSGMTDVQAKRKLATQAYDMTFAISGLASGVSAKLTGAGEIMGNLFNPKHAITKKIAGAALSEFTQEAMESGAGQLAQNIAIKDTVDKTRDVTQGVGTASAQGALAGGALGGGVSTGTAAYAVGSAVKQSVKQAQENMAKAERERAKFEESAKQAVETGDTANISNVTDKNFDLETSIKAFDELSQKEETDKQANFKQAAKVFTDYQKEYLEVARVAMESEGDDVTPEQKKEATKQFETIQKEMQKIAPLMNKIQAESKPSQDIKADVKATVESNDVEATKRVMGSIRIDPTSISESDADILLGSGIPAEDKALVQAAKDYMVATKNMGKVASQVMKGGKDENGKSWIGLNQYRDTVSMAIQAGNQGTVDKYMEMLSKFADQRLHKAQIATQAYNEPDQAKRTALLNQISLPNKTSIANTLVTSLQQEADAAVSLRNFLTEARKGLTEAAYEPTLDTTQSTADSTVDTTVEPTPVKDVEPTVNTVAEPSRLKAAVDNFKGSRKHRVEVLNAIRERHVVNDTEKRVFDKFASRLPKNFQIKTVKSSDKVLPKHVRDILFTGAGDLGMASGNTIYLNGERNWESESADIIYHELDHLATMSAISKAAKERTAEYQELENIWYRIKSADTTGMTPEQKRRYDYITQGNAPTEYNINEMITIAKSERNMTEWFKTQSAYRKGENLWESMMDLVARVLGITADTDIDAYTAIMALHNDVLKAVEPKVEKDTKLAQEESTVEVSEEQATPDVELPTNEQEMYEFGYRANYVEVYAKQAKGSGETSNPLLSKEDYMAKLANNLDIALEDLKQDTLTERQTALLKNVTEFDKVVSNRFDSVFNPEVKDELKYRDPMQFINWDANAKSAFTVALYDWVATKASETMFNDNEAINRIVNEDTDAVVPYELARLLQDKGLPRQVVIEDLGKALNKQLGYKFVNTSPSNLKGNLELSLGLFGLKLLDKMGLVTESVVKGKEIDLAQGNEINEETGENTIPFIRATADPDNKYKVHPNLAKASELFKNTGSILSKLFGSEGYLRGPVLNVPTEVVNKVKGTSQNVAKSVIPIIAKHQARKNFVNKGMQDFVSKLSDDQLKKILGYNFDTSKTQIYHRDGVEGKNQQIERSIQHWKDFVEGDLGNDLDTPFYFSWEQWKNLRLGIKSNTVNPQGDKFHRHMLFLEEQNQTLSKSNPEHMEYFKVAIAQGLGIGIDKQTNEKSVEDVNKILARSDVKAALDVIKNGGDYDKVTAVVDDLGEHMHTLHALQAWAEYEQSEGDEFTTSYSLEADGVTNGPAIATIQFAIGMDWDDIKKRLKRVSIGLDGDDQNYGSWKSDVLNDDNYQAIGRTLQGRITAQIQNGTISEEAAAFFQRIIGNLTSFDEEAGGVKVDKAGRNITKGSLMTAIYGSGKKSITGSMGSTIVGEMYKYIEKNANNPQELEALMREVAAIFGAKPTAKDITALVSNPMDYRFSPTLENKLKNLGIKTYGEGIWESIQDNYSEFMELRTAVNNMMAITFHLFKPQYDFLVQKRTEEMIAEGKIHPTRMTLPKTETDKIMKDLLGSQPILNNYFSKLSGDISEGTYVGKIKRKAVDTKQLNQYKVEQFYRDGKKAVASQRLDTMTEPGVSSAVLAIQGIDAATMLLTLEKAGVLNVFDAIFSNINDLSKNVQTINENFYDVNNKYSILGEAYRTVSRAVDLARKFDEENGTNVFESEGMKEFMSKQDNELDIMIEGYADLANNRVEKKEVIMSQFTNVAQYYFENSGFKPEVKKLDKASLEKAAESTAEDKFADIDFYSQLKGTFKTSKKRLDAALESMMERADEKGRNIESFKQFQADYHKGTIKAAFEKMSKDDQLFVVTELNTSVLGSSEYMVDPDNFKDIKAKQINDTNVEGVFDEMSKLGAKRESKGHQEHLRGIVRNIIAKSMTPLSLRIKGSLEATYGAIEKDDIYMYTQVMNEGNTYSAATVNAGLKMSAQEVLVHELVHAVLREGIEGNSKAKRELRQLFDYVKKNNLIKVEDLMDETTTREEAQKTLDYFMTVRTDSVVNGKRYSNYLHEFAAYALTNEKVLKALSNHTAPNAFDTRIKGKNLAETMRNLFNAVMDWVLGKSRTVKPGMPLDKAMHNLALNLANIEGNSKSLILEAASKAADVVTTGFNIGNNKITGLVEKMGNSSLIKNSNFKLVRSAGNLARTRYQAVEEFMEHLVQTQGKVNGRQGFVGSLVTEMLGSTSSTKRFHALSLQKTQMIDSARQRIEDATIKVLRNSFTMELKQHHKIAITKAGLKTDMTVLLDHFTPKQISQMLRKPELIKAELATLQAQLLRGENGIFYVNAAKALGHFMATGKASSPHLLMNARNIARKVGLEQGTPQDWEYWMPIIDRMATMQSMYNTHNKYRNDLAEIIEKDEEGFKFVMDFHNQFKKEAKDQLFDGSEGSIIKGYIKDINNPNKDVTVAGIKHEEMLTNRGYIKGAELPRDVRDPNKEPMYMWVQPYGSVAAYAAGIISLTSKEAKGTGTISLARNAGSTMPRYQGAIDTEQLKAVKLREAERMTRQLMVEPSENTNTYMVPNFNTKGQVIDYRYMMNDATKDSVLERNTDFDLVLGSMASNKLDKVNTREMNQITIDALHEQYLAEVANNPEAFLELSATSEDPVLREHWLTLPQEAKDYARKTFHKQAIYIRKDMEPVVFGFRKRSISSLVQTGDEQAGYAKSALIEMAKYTLGDKAVSRLRMAEDLWQEYVKLAKNFIVVRSGIVTLANAWSNSMQLMLHGVSMTDIVNDQAEAYREAHSYLAMQGELAQLEIKLQTGAKVDVERVAQLRHELATNPVHELIQDGLLQTIVDDVTTGKDAFSFQSKFDEKTAKIASKVSQFMPDAATKVGKELLVTEDSKTFGILNEAAQLSDFVARYTLVKHLKNNEGMSHADAIDMAMDVFVNYQMPTHPVTQYLNDMGLVWFTKYYFRVQKTIVRAFINNPARAMVQLMLSHMTGSPSILDSYLSPSSIGNRLMLPDNPVGMLLNSFWVQAFK